MLSIYQSTAPPWAVALVVMLACSGCTDTASLCEARLTPINLNVAPASPLQHKGTRP